MASTPSSSSRTKSPARKSSAAKAKLTAAPDRTVVLVMGMHRSGTSMLAGIFSRLGCITASHLLPANFANERGYYEAAKISVLNDRILKSAGSVWSDWTPIRPDWFASAEARAFHDEALALVDSEFGTAPLLLLKDPRICRLMPFWRAVFAAKGVALRIVHTHRNPLEVSASLQARDGLHPDYGALLWLRHTLEAEAACRDLPRYFTAYSEVMKDWQAVTNAAATALGLSWPHATKAIAAEIEAFISPDLKHFNLAPEEVLENPQISGWTRDCFEIVERRVHAQQRPDDQARLDEIRAALDQSTAAFAGLLEDRSHIAATLSQTSLALEALRKDSSETTATSTAAIEKLQSDLAQQQSESAKWAGRAKGFEEDLAAASLLRQGLEQQLAALQQQRATAQQQISALQQQCATAQQQTQDAHESAALRMADLQAQAETAREKLQARHDFDLRLKADALARSRRDAAAESERLHKALDQSRAQLEAVFYDKEQMLVSTSWRLTAPLRRLMRAFRR